MNPETTLRGLMTAIDEHRWTDLTQYLHPGFICHLVHSGESFTREQWIRFNADYPGFDRLQIRQLVSGKNNAACRSHVTSIGEDGIQHFECASFATFQDDLIIELTEVWTDVGQTPPAATRTGF